MDLTTYYCYDCDTRHDVSAGAAPFLCNTRDTSPKFVRLGDYGYATMPYRQVSAIISPHAGDADNTGNADNQGNTGNRSPPRRRTPPRGHDEASGSSTEITVLPEEWEVAKRAVATNTRVPLGATHGTLHAYHRILEENRRRLARERQVLDQRRAEADASSERRANLSNRASANSRGSRYRPRIPRLSEDDAANLTRNLSNSFITMDSAGVPRPKTKEGAAAHLAAYLINNPPAPERPSSSTSSGGPGKRQHPRGSNLAPQARGRHDPTVAPPRKRWCKSSANTTTRPISSTRRRLPSPVAHRPRHHHPAENRQLSKPSGEPRRIR